MEAKGLHHRLTATVVRKLKADAFKHDDVSVVSETISMSQEIVYRTLF